MSRQVVNLPDTSGKRDKIDRIEIDAQLTVFEFGKKNYQDGLFSGLQTAISIIHSVENEDAKAACRNMIRLEISMRQLPDDLSTLLLDALQDQR